MKDIMEQEKKEKPKFKIEIETKNAIPSDDYLKEALEKFKNDMSQKFGPQILDEYDFEISGKILEEKESK